MHLIVIASYLTAAAAFLVGTALLAVGWRGQRIGALLILATTVSLAWGAFLAWAEWHRSIAASWVLLAEVLRYGAWLAFVTALLATAPVSSVARSLRVAAHVLWIALALYCLLPVSGVLPASSAFRLDVPLVGILVLALIGLVCLEQIYRNASPEQRWALKFLVIAVGVMFAYDIFLYSYAVLYRQVNPNVWAARGFVNALLVPLLVVAAARNPEWSLDVGVSRRAVFYSSSLMVVAFYIIATAVGGYYVRVYGGSWGRIAEITLICFAVVTVLLLASSGQARARLRVFLQKNFFSFRYDYRDEWLRLTAALAADDTEVAQRAVRALAQAMDSPAGALFLRGESDAFELAARWNMPVPPRQSFASNLPAFELMRSRRWIYNLNEPAPLGDRRLGAPAELAALPHAWLLVPLLVRDERLIGFAVLAEARARHAFDWEDIDLLRTVGSQVAGTLAQALDARRLAEARQFEGFNRLTAFLMHDLKNVAAQQSLLLQNADRHKRNPAFVDDMLTTVANSVQRISRLLEQLRGDAANTEPGRVALASVIEKALAECKSQAPEPEYQPPAEALWIRADSEQLAMVLGHVLRNAQDAAHAHGHVTLGVRDVAGHAVIAIEDDGAGMDEEFIRDRLFKPFFTTKASRGMGIGAYQAREYVRSLGGTVEVDSTPGRGTVFTIRLPRAAAGAVAPDKLAAAQ